MWPWTVLTAGCLYWLHVFFSRRVVWLCCRSFGKSSTGISTTLANIKLTVLINWHSAHTGAQACFPVAEPFVLPVWLCELVRAGLVNFILYRGGECFCPLLLAAALSRSVKCSSRDKPSMCQWMKTEAQSKPSPSSREARADGCHASYWPFSVFINNLVEATLKRLPCSPFCFGLLNHISREWRRMLHFAPGMGTHSCLSSAFRLEV